MDEGEFDYELEDAGNDLFSGNHSSREALFLPFSKSGREAKEKRSASTKKDTPSRSGRIKQSGYRSNPCIKIEHSKALGGDDCLCDHSQHHRRGRAG